MERISANYTIVTPMFLGGANQEPTDGIRPPSIKGALRFWWRALNWDKIRHKHISDEEALKDLYEQEALLFGSAAYSNADNEQRKQAGKPLIGKSRFAIRIKKQKLLSQEKDPKATLSYANLHHQAGLCYLLGQGLYKYQQGVLHKAIISGHFTIECLLHPTITTKQRQELEQTLLALGLLGGLGSRVRKGFGSLAIHSITSKEYDAPHSKDALIYLLKSWKQNWQDNTPTSPFTAFSAATRIDLSLQSRSEEPLDLLNQAGEEMQLYRSWGRRSPHTERHEVNGKPAEKNFKQSHDLMEAVANNRRRPRQIPDKAVFGLPQNYFFSSTKKNVEFSLNNPSRSRRASPLFIHVHQFPNGETTLIQTLLPAVFLENDAQLTFKTGRNTENLAYHSSMTRWSVLEKYLDRFGQKETL